MYTNELYHHGVKGMRWGVRKKRVSSEDSITAKNIRKKKVREMSNQELSTVNKRMQLEKQYRDLKSGPNRAKSLAKAFIATAGTITAVTAAAKTYQKLGGQALNKIGYKRIKDISLSNIM